MRALGGWMVMAPSPGSQVYTSLEAGPLGPLGPPASSPAQRPLARCQAPIPDLSARHDIRLLVVRTLLTYLELAGYLETGTPIYAEYELRPLVPFEEILNRFAGERREFLRGIFGQGPESQDLVPHRPRSGGAGPGSAPRSLGAGPRLPGRAGTAGSPRRGPAPPPTAGSARPRIWTPWRAPSTSAPSKERPVRSPVSTRC